MELIPINEVKDKLNAVLANRDVADRHSFYQLQCFVIGKELTHQGKMRQCLLELKARRKNLNALELELEEQKDNLELLQLDIENIQARDDRSAPIEIRKAQRRSKSLQATIQELQDKIRYLSEEIVFLVELFQKLNREQPFRNWDEAEVQKEYWGEKLKNELNIRVLLRHPLDPELLKTIMALHDDAPVKRKTIELLQLKPASQQSLPEQSI